MTRRSLILSAASAASSSLGAQSLPGASPFPEILRTPDRVRADTEAGSVRLTRAGSVWNGPEIEVTAEPQAGAVPVAVHAPRAALTRIWLRWDGPFRGAQRFLGDHWERSYGDLEWRGYTADRLMPWYFLANAGPMTAGYGVKVAARSIAHWRADPAGITLCLDVHNGGAGVQLGDRRLEAATVVSVKGHAGESALQLARRLCRTMCPQPRLPGFPVYGGNNWYYTYGRNLTADDLLRDSSLMAELAPAGTANPPFMVLDMGWTEADEGAGPTNRTSKGFPRMETLAGRMKQRGVRPGVWVRPLLTVEKLPETMRLPGKQAGGGIKAPYFVLDPSVPEALDYVAESIRGVRAWGFELIKHDYTSYDITGRWGFQMGPDLTEAGWHFTDRSRTTAEIVYGLYRTIRESAGDALLIGCNTFGHLGAGLFELQRIGDDTSGREWSRTRKMGVNTLAFRLAQHGTFFAADADCVPVTRDIDWNLTRQWLDLVVRSATPLFVSADPLTIGERERAGLRAAFATASRVHSGIEPVDWMESTMPSRWRSNGGVTSYEWFADRGF
jgi:alpha-galactosidase